MRTIKFRGRRIDNGEWVYGYYVQDPVGRSRIYWKPFEDATSNTYHFVDPSTVGQFTDLHDKNGREIYEGNVVRTPSDKPMQIGWSQKHASFVIDRDGWAFVHYFGEAFLANQCEVIGNVHENSELL